MTPLTCAQITSKSFALANGLTYKVGTSYYVTLDFARYLYPSEFNAVVIPTGAVYADMPVNPSTPIVR